MQIIGGFLKRKHARLILVGDSGKAIKENKNWRCRKLLFNLQSLLKFHGKQGMESSLISPDRSK